MSHQDSDMQALLAIAGRQLDEQKYDQAIYTLLGILPNVAAFPTSAVSAMDVNVKIAVCYRAKGDTVNSLAYAHRAYECFTQGARGDIRLLSGLLDQMGQQFLQSRDMSLSEDCFRKVLDVFVRSYPPTDFNIASANANLGASLLAQGKLSEALGTHERALQMARAGAADPSCPSQQTYIQYLPVFESTLEKTRAEIARAGQPGMQQQQQWQQQQPKYPEQQQWQQQPPAPPYSAFPSGPAQADVAPPIPPRQGAAAPAGMVTQQPGQQSTAVVIVSQVRKMWGKGRRQRERVSEG
jgi:tetratricopeptide (TPR) repeat protein